MKRMMETLESRQMFSAVAPVEVAAPTVSPTAAQPTLTEIVVTKPVDKSSPKLFTACANGTHYPTVVVTM